MSNPSGPDENVQSASADEPTAEPQTEQAAAAQPQERRFTAPSPSDAGSTQIIDTGPPTDWTPPDDPDRGPGGGSRPPPTPATELIDLTVIEVDDNGIAIPDPTLRASYGRDRRFFSPAQASYVKTKWRRCAFPGCSIPITKLDIDHPEEWSIGGATDLANAIPCCPHHNRITRNRPGWTITMNNDATATLTTPLGNSYRIEPHNYLD